MIFFLFVIIDNKVLCKIYPTRSLQLCNATSSSEKKNHGKKQLFMIYLRTTRRHTIQLNGCVIVHLIFFLFFTHFLNIEFFFAFKKMKLLVLISFYNNSNENEIIIFFLWIFFIHRDYNNSQLSKVKRESSIRSKTNSS